MTRASIKKMTGSAPEPWHAVIIRPILVKDIYAGFATTHGWFESHPEALAFVRGRLDHPSAEPRVSTHRNAGLLREMGHDV